MNNSFRRWLVGVAALTILVPAGLAWACVGVVALTTSSSSVQAGGKVTVFGKEFAEGAPIDIHLDSPTGPVLATVPPPTDTMTSQWNIEVTIPPGTPNGQHFLVATQVYHYMNAGAPARAAISVGTPAPAPPGPAARPAKVSVQSAPSAAALILIALGVAVVGLAGAGVFAVVSSRRSPSPGAVKAT
jgi:hypothetical protein